MSSRFKAGIGVGVIVGIAVFFLIYLLAIPAL